MPMPMPNLRLSRGGALEAMCIMVAQNASALEVVGYSSGGRPAGGLADNLRAAP
jgi:hypothetical protein